MHSVREELSLFDCLAIFLAFCLSMNTISAIRTENAMPQLIASADRLTVLKQQPVPRMPRFLLLVRTPEIAAAARLFEVWRRRCCCRCTVALVDVLLFVGAGLANRIDMLLQFVPRLISAVNV